MNGANEIVLIVAMVIVLVSVAFVWQLNSWNNLTSTYQRLAARFRGRCNMEGLRQRPSVHFVHNSAHALLDIYSTGGEDVTHYTQLKIRWPDSRFRCEVYPEGVLSRVGKFFGMEDVKIGSPRFDEEYVIKGSGVRELRDFLNVEVQRRIERLRDLSGNFAIYVSVSGGQLLIKKLGLIRDYEQLEKFVLLALELYDEATRASAVGIEFVETKPEAKLGLNEAVCLVCGELVKLDAVFCRSCKTPHHKDCWEYYGACSTYGCGQQRYLVQRLR